MGRRYGQALLLRTVWTCILFCPKKTQNQMVMLDVGQGMAFICKVVPAIIFYRWGSTDVTKVGTYRILPFLKYHGIRKIDYWFVSHTDRIISTACRSVWRVVMRSSTWSLLRRKKGGGGRWGCHGETDTDGKKSRKPDPLYGSGRSADQRRPETAMCRTDSGDRQGFCRGLQCHEPLSFIDLWRFSRTFTGDIAMDQEASLVAEVQSALGENGTLAFLKVAHHGSKYSSGEDFWMPWHRRLP